MFPSWHTAKSSSFVVSDVMEHDSISWLNIVLGTLVPDVSGKSMVSSLDCSIIMHAEFGRLEREPK